MIDLVVVSLRGAPAGRALAASFGPAGGTIGRAPTNTLVLDDPDRTVSRVHAQILCRDGRYTVLDRGSNPLLHNGQPLGAGHEAPLSGGDRLVVGGFEISVQVNAAALPQSASAGPPVTSPTNPLAPAVGNDDPFADLMAGLAPAVAPPARSGTPAAIPDISLFPDPLGLAPAAAGAAPAARQADPFADLLGSPGQGGAAEMDGLAGVAAPSPGIDELFGLGAATPQGHDPLALSPLAAPLVQPNTAQSADPLHALQAPVRPGVQAQPDHVPVLQQAFRPPQARVDAAVPVSPAPAPVALAAAPVALDFDFGDAEPNLPAVEAPAPAPAPAIAPTPAPVRPLPQPHAEAPPVAPVPPQPVGSANDDVLLAAFLRGVGSTHQMPAALTPELMERLGTLLRTSTDGVLQLLLTRQEFKRGLRSEVTMISTEANNPLKFSPSVEVALAHLLGPGVRGFMPAEEAMSNAFADLRAHQFGVMVGLRAAFAHVLEVFTPEKLEQRIADKSRLDALFSANRKARLWDQFCQLYAGIATEAEDDFHSLFGKAFAKAYDEQMERFRSGG